MTPQVHEDALPTQIRYSSYTFIGANSAMDVLRNCDQHKTSRQRLCKRYHGRRVLQGSYCLGLSIIKSAEHQRVQAVETGSLIALITTKDINVSTRAFAAIIAYKLTLFASTS